MTEPKIARVPSPGDGKYWEQVDSGYVFYHPPDEFNTSERWSLDHFNPIQNEDEQIIHYTPMKNPLWYLSGEPQEPEGLWEDVKTYVYNHVDFTDPRLYDVATGWIMSTWIKEAFNITPYFRLYGVKNTGKTRVLEVFQELCYRAVLTPSVTEAALYRLIQDYGVTYLLDETEHYTVEAKTAIVNVLNSGYRRGQQVIRCITAEDGSIVVDGWDVFGPKGIAGTQQLRDTLESRCIQVIMQRAARHVNFYVDKAEAKKLRSRLLLWRFRRLYDLDEASEASEPGEPYLGGISEKVHLIKDSRIVELFTPLIALSEGEAQDNIIEYATDAYRNSIEEEGSGVEAEILRAIISTYDRLESGKFASRWVADTFNQDRPEREKWRTDSVGRAIKKLGFTSKRLKGGVSGYIYDSQLITRLGEVYDTPPLHQGSPASLGSLGSPTMTDYTTFDAARQQRFNDMMREAE